MSTNAAPPADTSTAHANWGTAVILLLLAISAVVIFYVVTRPHSAAPPQVISSPQSAPVAPVAR